MDETLSVPPPWDTLTVRQVTYLRHRLAQVSHYEIAQHYGITQSSVRHLLGRACRQFLCSCEADLLVLAERDGVTPLPLGVHEGERAAR